MRNKCTQCEEPLKGRSDKKFCSDYCRTSYYNKINSSNVNYLRQVNRTLAKNRKILETLNPDGKIKIHKDKLLKKGFNFDFFTNIYRTKTGNTYYFCYEQGYIILGDDFLALVKREEKM